MESFNCWSSKQEAALSIQCSKGRASLNFTCSLSELDQQHIEIKKVLEKQKKKSPSQVNREISNVVTRAREEAAQNCPPPPAETLSAKISLPSQPEVQQVHTKSKYWGKISGQSGKKLFSFTSGGPYSCAEKIPQTAARSSISQEPLISSTILKDGANLQKSRQVRG